MKIISSCAAILLAAVPCVSAAPAIVVSSSSLTQVIAIAGSGEDRSFTEDSLIPFDHTVADSSFDDTAFDYSATASAGLQISLDGLVLSGASSGAYSVAGSAIPGQGYFGYVASFEFLISIPVEDPSYTVTFTGNTSASGGAYSFLSLEDISSYYPPPMFQFGVNYDGVSPSGGNFVGVLEPGKDYVFRGVHNAGRGFGGGLAESSGLNFNLQMTPITPAAPPLEAVLPLLPNGQLESPTLELPTGLPPRFLFHRLDSSLNTHDLTVEWSTNPSNPDAWNEILIPVSSEGDITIIEHGSEPDEVQVSIPAAANEPSAFCRLKVEQAVNSGL